MNPIKLSFESEILNINYIWFNIQGFLKLEDIKKITFIYSNHFQLLENDLSKLFYSRSFSSLNLNSRYTNWLLNRYRIGSV